MNNESISSPFLSSRSGANSWATSNDNINSWRRGALEAIRPLTLEFFPTIICNARCPHCSFHEQQVDQCGDIVQWTQLAIPDDRTACTLATGKRLLSECKKAGVRGVVYTGGGEPTTNPFLLDFLRYSKSMGMDNGLYTNGFLLGLSVADKSPPKLGGNLVNSLLAPDAGLVFLRLSINTANGPTAQRHWGLRNGSEVVESQFRALDRLLRAREQLLPEYEALGRG